MTTHDTASANESAAAIARFRVLDLEVDAGRQTVSRGGGELHVPKLSFDLLLALLRAAPNTVSVPELMEQVWPRQVVGVETLTQRIKLLRRALSDSPAQPRYLSGERRRGYRILAPVTMLPLEEPTAVPTPPPAQARPALSATLEPRRRFSMVFRVTLGMLLTAILMAFIASSTHPTAAGLVPRSPATMPYSVAVMPFQAISIGADDAQLGRGISELVINRLTSESELSVIVADSALAPRGESESVIEVGRRLGVHYIVDGNVQREGLRVRVSAQLIDVSAGRHVGAMLAERSTAELFHLEDDIAGRISFLLLAKVHPVEASAQEFGADATLSYLRARALIATRKVTETEAAIQEFTHAIAVAPTFVQRSVVVSKRVHFDEFSACCICWSKQCAAVTTNAVMLAACQDRRPFGLVITGCEDPRARLRGNRWNYGTVVRRLGGAAGVFNRPDYKTAMKISFA